MKLRFISLASGSSGNCYYLGTETYGILVDAGIGGRTIKKNLKDFQIPLESILAVFVTHDHADHIKGVGGLGERCHIPIYTSRKIHGGMDRNYCMKEKLSAASQRFIEPGESVEIKDLRITAFPVPHDGTENLGYCIEAFGKTFSFLTDLGTITPTAADYIRRANYLVLEANYDEDMLRMGPYPAYLKERIRSERGHLSNRETANFLAEHYEPHLKHIWLCHLSRDNNHPELAYKTVELAMRSRGVVVGKDVQLVALRRTTPSELYEFD